MGNRRISSDLKQSALRLWSAGWETSDICDILRISKSSLYRWKNINDEHRSVNRPSSAIRRCPCKISRAVLTGLHLLLKDSPDTYLDELVWWLAIQHGIEISVSQLHQNLVQAGLTRKLLRKLAAERDEQLREDWRNMIKGNFQADGAQLIFVDETSKKEVQRSSHIIIVRRTPQQANHHPACTSAQNRVCFTVNRSHPRCEKPPSCFHVSLSRFSQR